MVVGISNVCEVLGYSDYRVLAQLGFDFGWAGLLQKYERAVPFPGLSFENFNWVKPQLNLVWFNLNFNLNLADIGLV